MQAYRDFFEGPEGRHKFSHSTMNSDRQLVETRLSVTLNIYSQPRNSGCFTY
jgi:hypothetical protein